jgi:hypothetical protein
MSLEGLLFFELGVSHNGVCVCLAFCNFRMCYCILLVLPSCEFIDMREYFE